MDLDGSTNMARAGRREGVGGGEELEVAGGNGKEECLG